MKSRLIFLISISACIIFLTGCPYESNFTLSDPKDSFIDPGITGKWLVKGSKEEAGDTLIIMRFNDREYYLESHELKNSKLYIGRGRGFITQVNNIKMLNLCDLEEPAKFYFAKYVCSDEKMILSFPSDQFIKTKFGSGRELVEYFKANIGKQGFFETGDTLIRVKK